MHLHPFLRAFLPTADFLAHFGIENFRAAAGERIEAGCAQNFQRLFCRRKKIRRHENEAERNIVAAVDMTAKRLGNTRSVCRKYYIHPALIEAYLEGSVLPPLPERRWNKRKSKGPTLRQHEMDVLAFLKARLKPRTRRAVNAPAKLAPVAVPAQGEEAEDQPPPIDELKPTGS